MRCIRSKYHRGFLLFLLAAFSVRCADEAALDPNKESVPARETSFAIDLSDRFAVADTSYDAASHYNLDLAKKAQFSHGWHRLESGETHARARWIEKRLGVVDVIRTRTPELRVQLTVSPPEQNELLEPQRLRVLWNGHRVADFKLEWGPQKVSFKVPAKFQKIGLNRLELLPSFWVTPNALDQQDDKRSMALKLHGGAFRDRTEPTATIRLPAATKTRGTIQQQANTVISYSLFLPPGAILTGSGQASDTSPLESTRSVDILITTTDGDQQVLFESGISNGQTIQVREDLSTLADQAVTLSFRYTNLGASPEAGGSFSWDKLRITGSQSQRSTPDFEGERRHYNVLLILFDTLRADHIEPYGSLLVKTPGLRQLASEGVTFLDSSSSSSWTRTAVASLFTSMYPAAHKTLEMNDKFSTEIPYLPEILRDAGYSTTFMTTNPTTGSSMGFSRGADHFYELWEERRRFLKNNPDAGLLAKYVWKKVIKPVLPENNSGQPFFIYLHEPDPHGPYTPVPPYDTQYEFGYHGNLSSKVETLKLFNNQISDLEPTDIRFLESLYNGEISFSDAYLKEILRQLGSHQLREDTLIIVVSDHGEEFLDHGKLGHGVSLFQEQIHVPILFSLPGVLPEGEDVLSPAELIDVPPTVLDLIGENAPATMAGQSLIPLMFRDIAASTQRPRHAKLRDSHDSIRIGDWKLIREFRNQSGRRFNSHSLYNLESDPKELVDVWAQEQVVGTSLRQELDWQLLQSQKVVTEIEEIPETELAPTEIEELKALGYL